jgi:hypothetical protein
MRRGEPMARYMRWFGFFVTTRSEKSRKLARLWLWDNWMRMGESQRVCAVLLGCEDGGRFEPISNG